MLIVLGSLFLLGLLLLLCCCCKKKKGEDRDSKEVKDVRYESKYKYEMADNKGTDRQLNDYKHETNVVKKTVYEEKGGNGRVTYEVTDHRGTDHRGTDRDLRY